LSQLKLCSNKFQLKDNSEAECCRENKIIVNVTKKVA